jgi:hypothetical protein
LEEGLQDGEDTADYSASTGAINANLDTGLVEDGLGGTDVLISIEKIVGTALDDHFVGGEGEWTIDGGGGRDTVDYSQIEGEVTISSDGSTVTLPSGKVQHLENIENIIGASTDDELNGGDGANVLIGGDGVDVMNGGKGMDVLVAGDGDDILYGGDDDEIDILDGGAGADKFYVSEGDIVLNFNAGDQVYLNGVLLTGGENFSQWMYDDASKYEQIKLSFVNGDGIAYTFVDAAFWDESSAMGVMTADMKAPVLVFGVDLFTDEEAEVRKVSSEEKGSWSSVDLLTEDGSMLFTRWNGIDHHIPGFDPIPEIPGYAKDLYDWQVAGGVPGTFTEEGTWDLADSATALAIQYGYDPNRRPGTSKFSTTCNGVGEQVRRQSRPERRDNGPGSLRRRVPRSYNQSGAGSPFERRNSGLNSLL